MEAVTGQNDFVSEVLELARRIIALCERDGRAKVAGEGAYSKPSVGQPTPEVVVRDK